MSRVTRHLARATAWDRVENTLPFPSSSSPLSHSFFPSITPSQQPGPNEGREMLLTGSVLHGIDQRREKEPGMDGRTNRPRILNLTKNFSFKFSVNKSCFNVIIYTGRSKLFAMGPINGVAKVCAIWGMNQKKKSGQPYQKGWLCLYVHILN